MAAKPNRHEVNLEFKNFNEQGFTPESLEEDLKDFDLTGDPLEDGVTCTVEGEYDNLKSWFRNSFMFGDTAEAERAWEQNPPKSKGWF